MMVSTQETLVPKVFCCYHCGFKSTDSTFKYFDNKKLDQPRYQCHHCRKFFTLGSHGRPQGKTYAKKRNEDLPELKTLSQQSCHCGIKDNAVFKYYNNHSLSQPRFKCLSCGKQFQTRLLGTGEERHLVQTSSLRTRAPRHQKQGVPEVFSTSTSSDGSHQPFGDEDAEFLQFLDAELLTGPEIDDLAPNVDAFSSATTMDGEYMLPPTRSNEDAEVMDFMEVSAMAPDVYMGPYGTLMVDSPAPFDSRSWSNDDSLVDASSMSYADAATAVCRQMDLEMEMARKNSDSNNADSTMGFADAFHVLPEPLLLQQASMEDEQCSDFHWNKDVTQMSSWV